MKTKTDKQTKTPQLVILSGNQKSAKPRWKTFLIFFLSSFLLPHLGFELNAYLLTMLLYTFSCSHQGGATSWQKFYGVSWHNPSIRSRLGTAIAPSVWELNQGLLNGRNLTECKPPRENSLVNLSIKIFMVMAFSQHVVKKLQITKGSTSMQHPKTLHELDFNYGIYCKLYK